MSEFGREEARVKVGDVLIDKDQRPSGRRLYVHSVHADFIRAENMRTGRMSRIAVERLLSRYMVERDA